MTRPANFISDRLSVVEGDITRLEVEAIVNAANERLLGGGGVDGAIHQAAGPELLAECRTIGGCPTGEARLTQGYNLPARFVIHTVGPIWRGGGQGEAEVLRSCYWNSFMLAIRHNIRSVAFPAISCGVYGYPVTEAVDIAIKTISDCLRINSEVEKIVFCCFDRDMVRLYQQHLFCLLHRDGLKRDSCE